MELPQAILLFFAAMLAGALNSVAGGGSFISFPALVSVRVPDINANATNTVALWPGSIASVGAYRRELAAQRRDILVPLALVSSFGGVLGALLLLGTSETTFRRLLPFLMLLATLLFAFGNRVSAWLRARIGKVDRLTAPIIGLVLCLQLVISIYGGYFGGGIGIMMLAALSLLGDENIHNLNSIKTFLASFINGFATLTFIYRGAIFWPQAVLMVVGAVIGGYTGAASARRVDPQMVRRFVVLAGFVVTALFFIRSFSQ